MAPAVGSARPSSRRASVVLPEPLSPTTAMIDGLSASIAKDNPARASVLSRPSPPGKRLLTSTASISGTIGSRQMAGHERSAYLARHRPFGTAAIGRLRTARVEGAAGRQVATQRRRTGDTAERAAAVEGRQCRDQRPRVGMARIGDDLGDRRYLD